MKYNNKNRKLVFIRNKNKFRLGKKRFKAFTKYSNLLDENAIKLIVEDLFHFAEKDLFKKCRLKLRNAEFRFGTDGEDFMYNRNSAIVELYN